MHLRPKSRRARAKLHALRLESLENRNLLSITPGEPTDSQLVEQIWTTNFHGADSIGKDGAMAKVGGDLTQLFAEYQVHQQRHAGTAFDPSSNILYFDGSRVLVDAVTTGSLATLKQQLATIGGQVTAEATHLVSAWLPINNLDDLATLSALSYARPVDTPVKRQGAVDSQGDPAMRSDVGRTQFGVDGSGVRVGVVSDSYNRDSSSGITAATDIASGDLPNNVQIVAEGTDFGDVDEGRAMLQIVHDVAPGATLMFATADGGQAAMANRIRQLANAGADVIVDDIGYRNEPFFQDGLIAQAIDEVVDDGVAFFSAAGNDGDHAYESDFRDSGQDFIVQVNNQNVNLGSLHDFDPSGGTSVGQVITVQQGGTVEIVLQWDQPFGSLGSAGSQNDVDIYLISAQGQVVAFSTDDNTPTGGGGDPIEIMEFENTTAGTQFAVLIVSFEGALPGHLKYINFGFDSEITTFDTNTGTSWGHPMATGAAGVGASSFFLTPEFGITPPQLNAFSAGGGTAYLFDTDGNRLSTPDLRDQPRFTGPDNANTTFFGTDIASNQGGDTDTRPNFVGTSAAAPHVAAVAALMIELAGGPGELTPAQIYSIMEDTAIDITQFRDDETFPGGTAQNIPNGVGYDFLSGYGLVNAQAALADTPAPPRAVADAFVTTVNTPIAMNVLGNDLAGTSGASLVPGSVTIVSAASSGTTVVNPTTGVITYTPNTDFAGTDSLRYTVTDTNGVVSDPATVTITVNRPPVAVDDSATTVTDVAVVIPVLANDTDTTPGTLDPATVVVTSGPTNGSISINTTTGAVTYTPTNGFSGNDSFTYTVDDNNGATSNVATVSIFVNAPPVANNDLASTQASIPVGINVLANDSDPTPGGSLVPASVSIVSFPANGSTSINLTTGVVTYTPNANFNGIDTFTYTVQDNNGATSNVATVTILVNYTPVAIDDVATTPAGTVVQLNVTTNDIDSDDGIDASSAVIITQPSAGTATINNGVVTYTPNVGFVGADFLTYRVEDTRGALSNIATVVFKVGPLHSLSGKVYVDLNDDQIKNGTDWFIGGVTIYLEKTDGPYSYTDLYVTEADGTYNFTELATGTYTIREVHPGYFYDGPEVVGNLTPASVTDDEFGGITLAGGVNGSGYDFTEEGLRAEFVAAYANRQAFFASGNGISFDGINLGKGDAFIALSGGVVGQLQATALSLSSGSVSLTLYDKSMKQVAKSAAGSNTLTYSANNSEAFFLKVSGTSSNVSVNTFVIPPIVVPTVPNVPGPVTKVWHNANIAQDIDGDGDVELDDIVQMIDALNRHGVGSLVTRTVVSNYYLDVDADATLSLSDVIPIIDAVNRRSYTASSSGLLASQESSSSTTSSDIAFALAVDAVMEDSGDTTVSKKKRV